MIDENGFIRPDHEEETGQPNTVEGSLSREAHATPQEYGAHVPPPRPAPPSNPGRVLLVWGLIIGLLSAVYWVASLATTSSCPTRERSHGRGPFQ